MRIITVLVLSSLILGLASVGWAQTAKQDVSTLLQDAAYTLNRFDEATTGLNFDSWKIPVGTKRLFQEVLSAVRRNVEAEEPHLNSLLGKTNVAASDLFDVYSEVNEAAVELQELSSNTSIWGDSETEAVNLAKLGAKASVLGANIGLVLRSEIVRQEIALRECRVNRR